MALKASATINTNVTWVMPDSDGSQNQVLQTNGGGVLGWVYPVLSTNTLQSGTTFYVSSGTVNGGLRVNGSITTPTGTITTLTSSNITVTTITLPASNILYATSNHSLFWGTAAGNQLSLYNDCFGEHACSGTSQGLTNIGIGFYALSGIENITGNNIAIGQQSMGQGSRGISNSVAIGNNSMANANIGSTFDNVAIGHNTLKNLFSYGESTAVGSFALELSSSGFENTAIGLNASHNLTTGFDNVAVGNFALYNSTSGTGNVAIGYDAGGGVLTASKGDYRGGGNTYLGAGTGGVSSTTVLTGSSAIGYLATVGCSDCMALGPPSSGGASVNVGIGIATPSAAIHVINNNSLAVPNGNVAIFSTSTVSGVGVSISTNSMITLYGVPFSSLQSQSNGTIAYCSDCTVTTPATCTTNLLASCVCAGSGSGAFAKRLNGTWYCN